MNVSEHRNSVEYEAVEARCTRSGLACVVKNTVFLAFISGSVRGMGGADNVYQKVVRISSLVGGIFRLI